MGVRSQWILTTPLLKNKNNYKLQTESDPQWTIYV